jgi:hypothetical protein
VAEVRNVSLGDVGVRLHGGRLKRRVAREFAQHQYRLELGLGSVGIVDAGVSDEAL